MGRGGRIYRARHGRAVLPAGGDTTTGLRAAVNGLVRNNVPVFNPPCLAGPPAGRVRLRSKNAARRRAG
jgi:hypothetical protein